MAFDHIATKGAIHISFETTKGTEGAIHIALVPESGWPHPILESGWPHPILGAGEWVAQPIPIQSLRTGEWVAPSNPCR